MDGTNISDRASLSIQDIDCVDAPRLHPGIVTELWDSELYIWLYNSVCTSTFTGYTSWWISFVSTGSSSVFIKFCILSGIHGSGGETAWLLNSMPESTDHVSECVLVRFSRWTYSELRRSDRLRLFVCKGKIYVLVKSPIWKSF